MDTPSIPNVIDFSGLASLKRLARSSDPQGVKAAAQQFEALFLQQVLQAMREASPQDGIFDSDQTRMYQSLLDQQLAQVMASKGNGTGLAAMIEKQLTRQDAVPQAFPEGIPLTPTQQPMPLQPHAAPLSSPVAPPPVTPGDAPGSHRAADDFVRQVWAPAADAARTTGIPTHFVVAQAALESGWGRAEPRSSDGRRSYNLFGIKAGRSWTGPVVEATTTEVVGGLAQKRVERFRAYASYDECFRDYASLLGKDSRYANVLGSRDAASFAQGLQDAGYASDPRYAAKLRSIIGSSALRPYLSA